MILNQKDPVHVFPFYKLTPHLIVLN